jgi:hypothetical protein
VSWLAALSAFVAVAAALHAWRSAARLRSGLDSGGRFTGGGARGPLLSLTVLDVDIRLDTPAGAGRYALLLSVANGSPVPRVFSSIELHIRCRTASSFTGVVAVPLSDSPDPGGSRTGEVTLRLPLAVDAEQLVIGWAHFATADVAPRDGRVDGYSVVLIGEAGERLFAEAGSVTITQG